MAIWFSSDLHLGHRNIIQYSNRGFDTVEAMDETLINNWNARVAKRDVIWFLGDLTLGGAEVAEAYLQRLNGVIHLIWGNHDRPPVRQLSRWASSQYAADINVGGYGITLCHYAMRVWNRSHFGTLMLYGHSHNTLQGNRQSLDVGVDAWNFRPVSLPEILERMALLPPLRTHDHHDNGQT